MTTVLLLLNIEAYYNDYSAIQMSFYSMMMIWYYCVMQCKY